MELEAARKTAKLARGSNMTKNNIMSWTNGGIMKNTMIIPVYKCFALDRVKLKYPERFPSTLRGECARTILGDR
jgi:hypothetical protein